MQLKKAIEIFDEKYQRNKHEYLEQAINLLNTIKNKKILLSKVKNKYIENYLNNKYKNKITWNKRLSRLSTFFNYFVRNRIIKENPCKFVEPRKLLAGEIHPKHKPKDLPIDMIKSILDRLKEDSLAHYLMTIIIADTGARPSEVLKIKKKNLAVNQIYLECTKTGQPRFLFFDERLGQELLDYASSHGSNWLFPYHLDATRHCTYDNLRVHFNKARADYKHPITNRPVHMYMLRHTYATQRACILEPVELMQLMGHLDFQTTLGYIHRSKQSVFNAYKKVKALSFV